MPVEIIGECGTPGAEREWIVEKTGRQKAAIANESPVANLAFSGASDNRAF